MYIPIRKRLSTTQILIATAVGVASTIYVWNPIIKEHIAKQNKKQISKEAESQPKNP